MRAFLGAIAALMWGASWWISPKGFDPVFQRLPANYQAGILGAAIALAVGGSLIFVYAALPEPDTSAPASDTPEEKH